MESRDKDKDIEKLTDMLSSLQDLYAKKKDQLEDLRDEISQIKDVINNLNSLISTRSFQTADEILASAQKVKHSEPKDEDYFVKEVTKEQMQGTKLKRKIFSPNEEKLLCVLKCDDLKDLEIKFVHPNLCSVKETSEDFIKTFLKGALIKIKENNPDLNVQYEYFKDTEVISRITISNLESINDYDLITRKLRELLSQKESN